MNSLDRMMGLDQMGHPQGMEYPNDQLLRMGAMGDEDSMMREMGVPPMDDPYAFAGMEAPQGLDEGQLLAQQMLGGQPPQLGQEEINALAFSLGLGNNGGITIDGVQDPMYSNRFNTLKMMGGL